jgi:plasmid stability protein
MVETRTLMLVLSLLASEVRVAQLIVRNLEPEVVDALKQRAARRGHSSEAEHREILREALGRTRRMKPLKQLLLEMPAVGDDRDFARPSQKPRRVTL